MFNAVICQMKHLINPRIPSNLIRTRVAQSPDQKHEDVREKQLTRFSPLT